MKNKKIEIKRKTKKAISFVFHISIYGFIWYAFNFLGFENIAFSAIFFLNVLNYSAAIANREHYYSMKELVDCYSKTVDKMNKTLKDQNKFIDAKDKNFKELRTKYILSQGENYKIKEMNQRLHEVNRVVVATSERRQ